MSWILFLYALEVGMCPETYYVEAPYMTTLENPYYAQMEAEIVLFELVHVAGIVRVDMFKAPRDETFSPINLSSVFSIWVEWGIMQLGFKHLCAHPVVPWEDTFYPGQDRNRAYNQIFFRIGNRE